MDNVTMIRKIQDLCAVNQLIGGECGSDDENFNGKSLERLIKESDVIVDELIDSLCEHKWKRYSKMIYECEICKTRRIFKDKED